MRILAIRGCNLASLAGEFEVDLAHGRSPMAGVFAIVGPDRRGQEHATRRDVRRAVRSDAAADESQPVVVGRGDDDPPALGAQDVRTLLRRGASAGWAEVDFESGDSRRYRARWSVRRARGRPTAACRISRHADRDRRWRAARRHEDRDARGDPSTARAVVRSIPSLGAARARRVRRVPAADGKDRSELLERMTGTEIYSKLSIAAHVKAALAEQRLRDGPRGECDRGVRRCRAG